MSSAATQIGHRPATKAEIVELAFQQLKRIFPAANKEQELKTERVPGVLVDILAQTADDRLLIFEVIHVPPPQRSLSYTTYPPLATLKETVAGISPEDPPVVVALTTCGIPAVVEKIFEQAQIPLIELSHNPVETAARLRDAFKKYAIEVSELEADTVSPASTAVENTSKSPLEFERKQKLIESIDRLNLTVFAAINILLLIFLGFISLLSKNPLLFAAVSISIAVVAAIIIYAKEKIRDRNCINPGLIIEREERKLIVGKNEWHLERHILLKARRKTEAYRFKVNWSGSSPQVQIACRNEDGVIQEQSVVKSKALRWSHWELKFDKPMSRGETKPILLKLTLPDPEHKVAPYYLMSYNHVWKCKEFECRLSISDDIKPEAVYFVRSDARAMPVEKAKITPTPDSHEYVIHEKPASGAKYGLEWDLKHGKPRMKWMLN